MAGIVVAVKSKRVVLDLTMAEANFVKKCIDHWTNNAKRKADRVHLIPEGRRTVSESADVQYIKTQLPDQLIMSADLLRRISVGGDGI